MNASLSSLLGYKVTNPNFPEADITLEMVLSHQSSLVECEPYYTNFMIASGNAASGSDIPDLKEILMPNGKFYNECLYSNKHSPGQFFDYVNLNYVIAGTIVELFSG